MQFNYILSGCSLEWENCRSRRSIGIFQGWWSISIEKDAWGESNSREYDRANTEICLFCHGWLASLVNLLLRFCGTEWGIFAVHEVLFTSVLLFTLCIGPQILPDIIRRSSKLFHNSITASPAYVDLEAFQKAAENGQVKNISLFTHELRLTKSTAEMKLMKESASIACQVSPSFLLICPVGFMILSWMSPFELSYLLRINSFMVGRLLLNSFIGRGAFSSSAPRLSFWTQS